MIETDQPFVEENEQRHIFRVNRATMTRDDVLASERERIFAHCWLYLGHESEVRARGDFVRRSIAGEPLFFVRGKDDRVRAFFNTCPHRGATICRQDAGQAKGFQCFYHAWSFGLDGALTGIPDDAGYGDGFDRSAMGLREVPRCDSYRGFIFVCFDEAVPSLRDYLGAAKDVIDLIVDACDGSAEIIAGAHDYAIDANWKLLVENSIDGYHGLPVHETYFKYLTRIEQRAASETGEENTSVKAVIGRAVDLGNGHAMVDHQRHHGDRRAHDLAGLARPAAGARLASRTRTRDDGSTRTTARGVPHVPRSGRLRDARRRRGAGVVSGGFRGVGRALERHLARHEPHAADRR
jgi:p-cumate 2,3-dioxygenase alpha subunit